VYSVRVIRCEVGEGPATARTEAVEPSRGQEIFQQKNTRDVYSCYSCRVNLFTTIYPDTSSLQEN